MVASCPLVRPDQFIQAVRDSGYRSTSCAIAELIDNSIEANARRIRIELIAVEREHSGPGRPALPRVVEIVVADDGIGMPPETLRASLQFAGSTRFNERAGLGRFGMGLPSASVSHSDLTEVFSWVPGGRPHSTALDCRSFRNREATDIPIAIPAPIPAPYAHLAADASGTIVAWKALRRVDHDGKAEHLEAALRSDLGRLFRSFIADGLVIELNGEAIAPFDPLYLMPAAALPGDDLATLEEHLTIPVAVPGRALSTIEIRFSMLPPSWQTGSLRSSKAERARRRIDESRGVSVVRAGREIDIVANFIKKSHWTDAWYRAEIRFEPELDELFGITNNKQWVQIGPGTPLYERLEKAMTPVLARLSKSAVDRGRARRAASPRLLAALAASASRIAANDVDRSALAEDPSESVAAPRGAVGDAAMRDPNAIASDDADRAQPSTPFFRHSASDAGIEVAFDESHPFHARFREVLRRDPTAATLIIDLLRTHRGGDVEGWSRRLAAALRARR